MNAQQSTWITWALTAGVVGAVFIAGTTYRQLIDVETCIHTRGCVSLSTEAAEKFARLEERVKKCEQK